MANSYQRATSDGTMTFIDISIDYLDRSEISVYFDDILTAAWSWSGTVDKRILFSSAVPNGTVVEVRRITDAAQLRHEFSGGAAFTAETLDEDLKQALHMAQEASEANLVGDFFTDINMHGYRVYNVGTAVNAQDVLTLGQAREDTTTATGAAASASASAASAAASASAAAGAVTALASDLANTADPAKGDSLIGVKSPLTGGAPRTQHAKNAERVSVADFLTTATPTPTQARTAVQAAIDSGAKYVYISEHYTIDAPISLAANQTVDFDGGSITTTASIAVPKGVITGLNKAGVLLIDPVVNASATAGVSGIWLEDCPRARVVRGQLTNSCIVLWAASNAIRMDYRVTDTAIDMAGWQSTALFVRSVFGAKLDGVVCFNGIEGVGIYAASKHVTHSNCESYGHTRDGFVVIAGQRISYSNCISHTNTQSGFTTQRLTAGTDTQRISYTGCHAYDNLADGFDLRGANSTPWGVNMYVTCDGCHSDGNAATGFYVVMAEGTTLTGCTAAGNLQQGYLVDQSSRTQLGACRSVSNASGVPSGTGKAGILVQASPNCSISGCDSENSQGATQEFGISFTGASTNCTMVGGTYLNNTVQPFRQDSELVFVTGAAIQSIANVYVDSICGVTGIYAETGLGVPTHTRPKASIFRRLDSGGGGEVYASNGAGGWALL